VEARKTVTLLFCDVSGSTALGERLDPEALRNVMTRYFEVARVAVGRHGGTVEKFVGDAVMAVFGIPEVREDDALRAVRAAADLGASLALLSEELMDSVGVGLAVRTGVNTGPVVAGSAFAGGSFATGDAVNTAARLEQAAAPGEILIGADTWYLVRDAVEVAPISPLVVKGKSDPVPAYRLVRILDSALGRSRRPHAALVGRERESRELADALARTIENATGQLLLVLGSAGMGKTRLVEDFVAGVGEAAVVLTARCVSYGRGITFWPIVQLLRQAAGLSGIEAPDAARAAVIALLDSRPDAPMVADRLLPLLGHGGEPGGIDETFWSVCTVLAHLAAQRPMVVVVDDVHWAEPTLLDLLERIRDETRVVPLLLLCQARPELLDQRSGWADGASPAATVVLEPFNRPQTAALLEGLLGQGVPEQVVRAIDTWAQGNPLFTEEIVKHLVEQGRMSRQPSGWVVDGDLAESMPPTLTALLAARLDRLPRPERALLEHISVIGLEMTADDARLLANDDVPDVAAVLNALKGRDLLWSPNGPGSDRWAFRHVLVREAAYSALPKSVRAELHERFAGRLAEFDTDAGGEVHAFIGYHLEQAARYRRELSPKSGATEDLASRAVEALAAAAVHANDVGDGAAAAGLLERALKLNPTRTGQRRELFARLAIAQRDQGYFAEALQNLQQAVGLMDATSSELERTLAAAQLLRLRASASEDVDPAELRAAADIAAALAREQHDYERLMEALNCGVTAAMMSAHWTQAEKDLRELIRIGSVADRRGGQIPLVVSHVYGERHVEDGLAYVASILGQPGQWATTLAYIQFYSAALLAAAGRDEEAVARLDEARQTVPEPYPFLLGNGATCAAAVYVARGDLERAIQSHTAGIDAFRSGGGLAYASSNLAWRAALLLELGGHDAEAQHGVDEAAAVTSRYDVQSVALLQMCRALLSNRRGAAEAAAAQAADAIAVIDTSDDPTSRADIRRWLSEIPRCRGDLAGQRRLLLEARDLYRTKGHQPLTAATEQALARIPTQDSSNART